MIKKIVTAIIFLLSVNTAVFSQFNIAITYGDVPSGDPHSSYEGDLKQYDVTITLTGPLPSKYQFIASVSNGTIVDQSLIPSFPPTHPVALYVKVRWNCSVASGTGSITVTETKSGISTTYTTTILSYFNSNTYCKTASPAKQNLLWSQTPQSIEILNCSPYCHSINSTAYQYQWQVGDVPIGTFPQEPPLGYADINTTAATFPGYLPPTYSINCIKAYRRKTTYLDGNGNPVNVFSTTAVISTFDVLTPGAISGGTSFINGIPGIVETPAAGGLCDGFNYQYTWESSPDNVNWTEIGHIEAYPVNAQVIGICYIRRKVYCNGETLYTNTLFINPPVLVPGTISCAIAGATIVFNTIPTITQTAASGGVCTSPDFIYTWERSLNNGPWLAFSNGINYPVNAGIIGTCKIRRKVHCVFEDAYTNELSFTMLPYTFPNAENLNYVRTNDIVIPGVQSWEQADGLVTTGDKLQTTNYLDNFGRSIQSIVKQGGYIPTSTGSNPANDINNYEDLVSYIQYDGLGRADKSFLPYATMNNLGFFKTSAPAEQQNFVNQKFSEPVGSVFTYSQVDYDGSPLNRIVNTKLAGAALNNDPNYKGISNDYDFYKTANEYVVNWDFDYTTGMPVVSSTFYADFSLVKNITKDEKDKLIVEYKDLNGKVILKRVQEAATVSDNSYTGWLNTYYVYDDFGNLRFTISPKAVALLATSGWSNISDPLIKKGLCFYQDYDKRGRTIVKHSPDGGEVWLVYDNRDRLIMSQDENQRSRNLLIPAKAKQWSFSLYDDNDRVITTGLINDSRDRNAMQTLADGLPDQNQQVQIYVGSNETITAYNPIIATISSSEVFINSVNYYDDYTHRPLGQNYANLTSIDFAPSTNAYLEQPTVSFSRTKNASTINKIRVLYSSYDNETSSGTQFLTSTIYYDDKGRVSQSYSENIKTGVDASAILYDFAGKIISIREKHSIPGTPSNDFDGLFVITKNDFDLLGRVNKLSKLYTKNSSDISILSSYKKMSEVKFDEFGAVIHKQIGDDPDQVNNPGKPLEIMDYSYNIQGRLTGVNKNYALANATGNMNDQWERRFGFYLGYENADNNFVSKQYNGSITGVIWRSQGDNIQRKYDYEYDNINRFKAANFTQRNAGITGAWSNGMVDLTSSVSGYDANGNITGLKHTGIVPGTTGGILLDDLQYDYYDNGKSNKLKQVTDLANSAFSGKQGDFKDYFAINQIDYNYDFNGNLKYDKNKNIIDVSANQTDLDPAAGIINNFLDLPQSITVKDKSKTEYIYDAAGNKLGKKVTQLINNPPAPVTTWYITGFVYQETSSKVDLQYILNEEGKLRIIDPVPSQWIDNANRLEIKGNVDFANTGTTQHKWGVWDYYIKDNLGNTRMVLTEESHEQQMRCTMEDAVNAVKVDEEKAFGNPSPNEVADTRFGPTPGWSSNSTKASKLQPATGIGSAIGPNAILKVMAGDIINLKTDYYYQSGSPSQPNSNVLNNIVQSLFGMLSNNIGVSSGIKDGIDQNYLQNNGNSPIPPFLTQNHPVTNDNRPRAYLNYIFFDEQFNYVGQSSGAMMVQGAGDGQTPLVAAPKATKNGYVYVYLSNETPNMPVYFDNLNITQTRGPIIEDNAYYPFGLKIQGISAKAAGKIKAKEGYQANYNQQDDETGYDEFAVRFYDPQIGRWLQVDPNIVQPGMYNGMNNDPINFTDPSGGDPDPNWYLNDETREIEFFEGSAEKKGYKNLGETYNGWVTGADGETRWTNFLSNGTYTRFLDNVTVGNGATLFRQKIEKELDGIMEDYDSRHSISQLNDDGSLNKREYDPHANAFWTGANFFSNTFVSMYNGVHGMYQMAQHPAEAVNNLAYRYAGAQFYLMTNSTGQVLSDAGSFIKNKATDVHTYEDALALAATIAVSKGNFGASGGAMTLDQIALKDLVKEATLNGRKALTVADTKIVTELANEVKYPGFRATLEDMNPINNHWGGGAHIHLPGIRSGHIPIQ